MATVHPFDGLQVILPGVYSNIKSGFKNIPSPAAYGNTLIIDTDSGAGAGGGSGVIGTIDTGTNAVYEFDNLENFQAFVEKGRWYLLSTPLFKPLIQGGVPVPGVSKIVYIKAATTVPAKMIFAVGNDVSDSVGNIGNVEIYVRSEGLVGNGTLNSVAELSRGYAFKVEKGVLDTTKFIMKFYRGTFRGLNQDGNPIGGIAEVDAKAELLITSKEFKTITVLKDWMLTNFDFNKYFKLKSSVIPLHDKVDEKDRLDHASYILATGGTESYTSANLISALLIAKNMNLDFVFADKFGVDSQHANNLLIFDWAANTAKFKPQVYIASGSVQNDFITVSSADTAFYNSQVVTVVHGGAKLTNKNGGFDTYDSYYKAANLLGREAGLAPQVPLTFKDITIHGETHILNDTEMKQALQNGILVTAPDEGKFACLKGINSLQANEFLLNENGTTHSKQLFRIAHQLNKELLIEGKKLLKDPNGVNRNTLSATDVEQWTKQFLQRKVAEPKTDNLILSFKDVTVVRKADAYFVTYFFVANTEISFLFFTGLILEV